MADVRPFRGLRYNTARAGAPPLLIAPPFDVIGPEEQAALHRRSPYNIIRVEFGQAHDADTPENNRYTRAQAALREWIAENVLVRDTEPRFYVYDQEFQHKGSWMVRRALMVRLGVEPWDAGVVLPHEYTLSKPKEDRLNLLRHIKTNVSPVFLLHRDPERRLSKLIADGVSRQPLFAGEVDGQRHTLFALDDPDVIASVSEAFADKTLYIADGHHRFETALNYRNERKEAAENWTGDEPENFVLAGIVAAEDAGLVLLGTHRLVRERPIPDGVVDRLSEMFYVEPIGHISEGAVAQQRLTFRMEAAQPAVAIGAVGLIGDSLHLLTIKDPVAIDSHMPADWQSSLRSLDVSVLQCAILDAVFGIPASEIEKEIAFTKDASEAIGQVAERSATSAFLINATQISQVLDMADEGLRMPQKSTFFYPKLGTGLVLNPHD